MNGEGLMGRDEGGRMRDERLGMRDEGLDITLDTMERRSNETTP